MQSNKVNSIIKNRPSVVVKQFKGLFYTTCLCVLMVYLFTIPASPGFVCAKIDLDEGHLSNTGFASVRFNPQQHAAKHLWLEMDVQHNATATDPAPLVDGYITVFAHGKMITYGKCEQIARYRVALGVKRYCKKCRFDITSGEIEYPLRTEGGGAALVPPTTRIELGDKFHMDASIVRGSILLTDLPRLHAYSNCSLLVDFGGHVPFDKLTLY